MPFSRAWSARQSSGQGEIGKGRHTTTHLEMFELDFGGRLVDTPGMREFGLWDIAGEELAFLFPEMAEYVGQCKFGLSCQSRPGTRLRHSQSGHGRRHQSVPLSKLYASAGGAMRSPRAQPSEISGARHCHVIVSSAHLLSGVNNRNHCPYCLWSCHLDLYTAGDRLSACKAPMKPIGLTMKRSRNKYQLESARRADVDP